MTKEFLITRPLHDEKMFYLYSFSKAIIQIAKENKKILLINLEGERANRKELESALNKHDKGLVYLNGHGDERTVFGHNDMPILDKDNIKITKNRILYALACSSLVELGQLAVENGAQAYIGYRDEFMWVVDPSKSAAPDKDRNAAPFRKVCHALISFLVNGEQVGTAVEKTKMEYKKLIKSYGTSEDDPFGDAPAIGLALSWDLLCLDAEGDKKAVF